MMDEAGRMLDIVTLGESMLRFTPPPPQALEQSPTSRCGWAAPR